MPTKSLELPLKVAQAFARDMRAFFEARTQLEQDEIASRQLHALQAFQHPRSRLQQIVTDKRGADVRPHFEPARSLNTSRW
jgi:hypothetical protein